MLSVAGAELLPAPRPAGIAAEQLMPLLEWFGTTFHCLPPATAGAGEEADGLVGWARTSLERL
jgi:hypothetical protein